MNNSQIRCLIFFVSVFASILPMYGAKEDEPIKIGNFLLPASQQTTPLFAFGQNIMDQGNLLASFALFQAGGEHTNIIALSSSIFYGIRNDLVLNITLPFTLTSKQGCNRASGANDMTIQLEKAIYTKSFLAPSQSLEAALQSTIVTNMTIPTGSPQKNPSTGLGSPSFFLGITLSYTAQFWEAWIQTGGTITTKYHGTKSGNSLVYQAGLERCFSAKNGWLIAGFLEFLGNYTKKNKLFNLINNNSGQNSIYLAPSLWASSERLRFQLGVAIPVMQHLFGKQNKNYYILQADFTYKFR